mmetsp:Transcript_2741/g.5850  ORF Transcript_2741/g.5850 Transcript_2741/m.5850 type:complete len:207 (+) Transcript_2741:1838-2458(+)
MSDFILRIMTVEVSIVWSSASFALFPPSSFLPFTYLVMNSASSHQIPLPTSVPRPRLPNTDSWGHNSLGRANAGVPLNNKQRSAAFNNGNTVLVRFVDLDLRAWDSSKTIALNMPGWIRLEVTRLTMSPMEQITTRVEPSYFSITSFPEVSTLICLFLSTFLSSLGGRFSTRKKGGQATDFLGAALASSMAFLDLDPIHCRISASQ